MPSLPTTTSAGTYNRPPETSRLMGSGSGNGTACRDERDVGAAGAAVDGEDANVPPGESPNTYTFTRHAIRSNYMDKSIEAKKKVIRMLFVVVAEFFVCWAPLHVLNTWYTFNPDAVYRTVGSTGVSLVQLLAYISSCCNPITYCFMNRKFRQAFLAIFNCYRCWSLYCCCCCGDVGPLRSSRLGGLQRDGAALGGLGGNNSDVSGNDSTVFVGRASTGVRSAWFQKWWSWKPRIVFSSAGVGEQRLHAAGGGIVQTPPAGHGGSFRYRITWRRSSHQATRHFGSTSGSHFDSSGSCSCTICPPSSSSSDLYS